MKKLTAVQICFIAFAAAINIVVGNIVLAMKLPVYLDAVGTILVAALMGPVYGVLPGVISGIITGITLDIYSFYFIPVQIVTGVMAGLMFKTKWMEKWKLPFGALCMSIPGTIVGASIAAYVFGGVTSSGSSIIVVLLNKLGMNMVTSAFVVQVLTDYMDRLISVGLVVAILAMMSSKMKMQLKK